MHNLKALTAEQLFTKKKGLVHEIKISGSFDLP